MRVIIVDDESKVCKLIYHLVDWSELGMEVVKILHDGLEAKDYILKNEPDIVITDIRMPQCDGLEMVKQVREHDLSTSFIIVSGFSNFEYAKQAIKYGVEDYLLKPLEKKEIVAALENIKAKKQVVKRRLQDEEELKEIVSVSREKAKYLFVSELIHQREHMKITGLKEINDTYSTGFVSGFFMMIKFQPHIYEYMLSDGEMELILGRIEQSIKEKLTEKVAEFIYKMDGNCIWCILNDKEDFSDNLDKDLKKMRMDVLKLKDIFKGLHLYVAYGSMEKDICNIERSISCAEIAMHERVIYPNEFIFKHAEVQLDKQDKLIDMIMREDIIRAIERRDEKSLSESISLVKGMCKRGTTNGNIVFECYETIVDCYCYAITKLNQEFGFPDKSYFLNLYNTFLDVEQVFEGLNKKCNGILTKYNEFQKRIDRKPIKAAKNYISTNYNKQITLEDVSKEIGFNPAYFSSLFKKETGKNFLEYLTELRVHKASQLLSTTDYSILEVANEVGYTDIKYFARVFKRVTELTPTEYRRLYS